MLRSTSRGWFTVPVLVWLALMMALGVIASTGSGQSVVGAARTTCPPLVFTSEIDPAVALTDTGPELDCIPFAFEDPYGPEKHTVPLAPSDQQEP